jgi:predicted hydrocarbon binding protein
LVDQRLGNDGTLKEVLVSHVEPGAKLAQLVVKLKDTVGAVASVYSLLATLNVDIRQSTSHSLPGEPVATYNALLAFRDLEISLDQLVERVKLSPFVLDVRAVEGREGFIIDSISFPVNGQGRRVVVFNQRAMARVFEGVWSTYESGAHVILHKQGWEYGTDLATFLLKTLGEDFVSRNYDYLLNLLSSGGWGVPELVGAHGDLDNQTIRISYCFECTGRRKHHRPVCSFTAGFLAGALGKMSGHPLICKESECSASGGPFCEFVIRSETGAAYV